MIFNYKHKISYTVQAPYTLFIGSHNLGLHYKLPVNRCKHSMYSYAGIGPNVWVINKLYMFPAEIGLSWNEDLFLVKICNLLRFVDTLFYSRLISSIHFLKKLITFCCFKLTWADQIVNLEYSGWISGLYFHSSLLMLTVKTTMSSCGFFNFWPFCIYKIMQFLFISQPPMNRWLSHTIIMWQIGMWFWLLNAENHC